MYIYSLCQPLAHILNIDHSSWISMLGNFASYKGIMLRNSFWQFPRGVSWQKIYFTLSSEVGSFFRFCLKYLKSGNQFSEVSTIGKFAHQLAFFIFIDGKLSTWVFKGWSFQNAPKAVDEVPKMPLGVKC